MTAIGLLLFPRLTQLDLTGPFEVLTRVRDVRVELVAASEEPVTADSGLRLLPSATYAEVPQLDVLVVPGGRGVGDVMLDDQALSFLRRQAAGASVVASVCTGALVLGAAGLLDGYRATTHWAYLDLLEQLGAVPSPDRVVRDRDRITGGGITAGIDAALTIAAALAGERAAREIELQMEYAPAPPFRSGHPDLAGPELVSSVRDRMAPLLEERRRVTAVAAERLRRATPGR